MTLSGCLRLLAFMALAWPSHGRLTRVARTQGVARGTRPFPVFRYCATRCEQSHLHSPLSLLTQIQPKSSQYMCPLPTSHTLNVCPARKAVRTTIRDDDIPQRDTPGNRINRINKINTAIISSSIHPTWNTGPLAACLLPQLCKLRDYP